MPSFIHQMLCLGQLDDSYTIESNNTAENVCTVFGSQDFGTVGSPFFSQSAHVTLNDNSGTGNTISLDHNQPGEGGTPDDITFTLDGATCSSEAASTIRVDNVMVKQASGGASGSGMTMSMALTTIK